MLRRKCAACREWFSPTRSDARYCSPGCKQRAYRRRRKPGPLTPIDCIDQEHDKHEGESEREARRQAANWQIDEALRLADEFALCRDGASPTEISRSCSPASALLPSDGASWRRSWQRNGRRAEKLPPKLPPGRVGSGGFSWYEANERFAEVPMKWAQV
jgi:hypothetical protein